jgi:hypothetical protein
MGHYGESPKRLQESGANIFGCGVKSGTSADFLTAIKSRR